MPDQVIESAKAEAKKLRLSAAFNAIFGQPDKRSSDQRLVVEHLRQMCGRDGPVFLPNPAGQFDPIRAAQIDGAQTQYLIIKRQLAIFSRSQTVQQVKKVKR